MTTPPISSNKVTCNPSLPSPRKLTGNRPARPTIWRWMRKGVAGGVTFKAVPIYGQWRTTEAAFRDFLDRRAEAMLQPRNPAPAVDDDTLRDAGLL